MTAWLKNEERIRALESEIADLRACGDMMQSDASRVVGALFKAAEDIDGKDNEEIIMSTIGYEAYMSYSSLCSGIKRWTEIRKKSVR